jgi:hypothetical protein
MKKNKVAPKKAGKKSLKNFMKDEAGNMTRENILKMGLGTVAALSMFSGTSSAQCGPGASQAEVHDNEMVWVEGSDSIVAHDGPHVVALSSGLETHLNHMNHCSY